MKRLFGRCVPRRGFTLVELLVVVSILGLLIAILVPSLSGARRSAKRVACGANLRSIGHGLRSYLNDSNDFLPVVERLPSIPFDASNPRPSIATVLLPHIRKNAETNKDPDEALKKAGDEVFKCPADVPGVDKERSPENRSKSYFQTENSSYMFNVYLNFLRDSGSFTDGSFNQPVKLSEIVRTERAKNLFGGVAAEEEIWLLRDYFGFHAKPGTPGASNYLYVDGHVADLQR